MALTQRTEQEDVSQLKKALLALKEMRARVEALEGARTEPLAVIGMGCRFPGDADSPVAFWKLLMDGVDAITEVPAERWTATEIYATDFMEPGKANTRWGGFLRRVDQFDPAFFGISPREAMHMDPQQRILLEVAYEALENAGQSLEKLEGSLTGVFAGIHSHSSDYAWLQMRDLNDIDTHTGVGTAHSIVANRVSYLFDWQGPSIAVDTACSSSLVATHLACQSLRNRECNLALVAGVNLFLTPESTITFSKLQMMAADGRCKTFDERADGFVRGEGCGVLVLKRLSDAQADGDRILALVQGSAVNQDGRTNGLTAPNGLSQQNVLRQALASGRVSAEQVTYIETHGTGTKLGDPIEVEALAEVIGQRSADAQTCVLGSVKANIGHLEAAAGIAGLIKTILVLQNDMIPAQLHLQKLNPLIRLEDTRFEIPTSPRPYPRAEKSPRFAGVSSFGFGGTNAHIILREAPRAGRVEVQSSRPPFALTLSARGEKALHAQAEVYRTFFTESQSDLSDIVFTANTHRTPHENRLSVVGSSAAELAERLEAFQCNDEHPDVAHGKSMAASERGLAFVFSGQGSQWAGMGRELLQTEPIFRDKLSEIDGLLKQYVSWSLLDALSATEESSKLAETEVAQPALFAIQVALTALWKSWGIIPEAVVGHSAGEIAAAHVSGVLTLEEAVLVAFHRSRLMQRVTGLGKMAAFGVTRAEAEALAAQNPGLALGAVNSPNSTVLSGDAHALETLIAQMTDEKKFARMLPVNYAFHSPVMDGLLAELTETLKDLRPRSANLTLYSSVRGDRAQTGDYDAAYWARNIRQTVLFGPAIQAMAQSGFNTFVEVSPHPVLSESINQCLDVKTSALIVPSLRRNQPERGVLLRSLGALFTRGFPVQWPVLYPQGKLVDLPTYAWQNDRYWLPKHGKFVRYERIESDTDSTVVADNWIYDLHWKALPALAPTEPDLQHKWLILADQAGLAEALAERFKKSGHTCKVVMPHKSLAAASLFAHAEQFQGVLDLRAIDATEQIEEAFALNTLATMQGLVNSTAKTTSKLWLVTRSAQRLENEQLSPEALSQSLLWGLGRTFALEHPEHWGGLIDIGVEDVAALAEAIFNEATGSGDEDQIAVRGGKRFGLRLERSQPSVPTDLKISADGTYLITGGLGGLGQQVARWLTERGAKHLVLTSRTGSSTRSQGFEKELKARGVTLAILKADVADEGQMTALFDTFGRSLPILRGVIHAAGVTSHHPLAAISETSARAVLSSKVTGGWLLHRLTQSLSLDFFVLFSSSSAVLGSSGLAHYAAANQFLDTLAELRQSLGLTALSVNWGWWAGEGLATAELASQFQQIGQQPMPIEAALQTLETLMAKQVTRKVVAAIDWSQFQPIYEAKRKRPLIENLRTTTVTQSLAENSFAEKLKALPIAQRPEKLKAHVRDQVAHVLGFGASDTIDPQLGFFSIGMDSVMAVQLRVRLEASLGHSLPSTVAFEYPTLEALTNFLVGEILRPIEASAMTESGQTATESSTHLSEDELLSKLDDELAAFNKLADGD